MDRRAFHALSGAGAAALMLAPHAAAAAEPSGNTRRIAPRPTPLALKLPDVELRTQDDKKVRLYEDLLKGKIFLINMFFIACTDGQCPVVAENLSRVQELIGDRLGHDIFMYSISLDPEHDRPVFLKDYAQNFNARPGWMFLTGDKLSDIDRLRKALGYWDPNPVIDAEKTSHTGVVMLGSEPLDRWICSPALTAPREIMRSLSYLDHPTGLAQIHNRG